MKRDTIGRVFIVQDMFKSGPVTTKMIQDRLNITRPAAERWIMQMMRHMPIVKSGLEHRDSWGKRFTEYSLMGEK